MLYARKLLRELRAQLGQSIAVTAVTFLGVLLFVTSGGAYLDLRDSYAHTRIELGLADLQIAMPTLRGDELDGAGTIDGVAVAEARSVVSLPVRIAHGDADDRVELRVVTLPASGEPTLGRVWLAGGRLPAAEGELVLDKHLAEHHGLAVGARVRVDVPGFARELTIVGIGSSAEYLWVWRDENDVMPSASAFGVGWMRRDALRTLARAAIDHGAPATDALADAASDGLGNELLVRRAPGWGDEAVLAGLRGALGDARVGTITTGDDVPGVRLLQMDVDGYKGMASFFPPFFLGVGAFIVATILGRMVDGQRALIGTLMALGVSRTRVLCHYLAFAIVLGGGGAVLGGVVGMAATPALTHAYASELGIPFVRSSLHLELAAVGIAIACAVALAAGWLPAWRASRLAPAEAMRPPRPHTGVLTRLARRLSGAPLSLRMAIRDVLGRPLRSLGTAFGIAAALVLVLTTGAMFDSLSGVFGALFDDARRYDLRADLLAPETSTAATTRFAAIDGVERAEPLMLAPARLAAGTHASTALVQGLAADAELLRSIDSDGTPVAPTPGGVVLTRGLARALEVERGDTITIAIAGTPRHFDMRVTGFADAAIGPTASVLLADLQRGSGMPGLITSVAIRAEPDALARVRSTVAQGSSVAHVEDAAELRGQIDDLMGLGVAMMGMMLVFAVVLAAAILFNTATLGILERRREIATLRALGRSLREIGIGLLLEHLLIATVGLVIGWPLAMIAIEAVLDSFSSDLFALPFAISTSTVVAAVIGILLVLLLGQWIAVRQLRRDVLAEAVRTREG